MERPRRGSLSEKVRDKLIPPAPPNHTLSFAVVLVVAAKGPGGGFLADFRHGLNGGESG